MKDFLKENIAIVLFFIMGISISYLLIFALSNLTDRQTKYQEKVETYRELCLPHRYISYTEDSKLDLIIVICYDKEASQVLDHKYIAKPVGNIKK